MCVIFTFSGLQCAEDVAEAPDTAEEGEYAEEFLPEEEGDGYENQFDDGYDLNLGEDYVGTHDNYPGYDDYDDGGDGEGIGVPKSTPSRKPDCIGLI